MTLWKSEARQCKGRENGANNLMGNYIPGLPDAIF